MHNNVHQTAKSLDAERQRRDIQQEHIFETAGQNLGLDGCTQGDGFVRILRCVEQRTFRAVKFGAEPDAAVGFLEFRAAKNFGDELPHERHAGLSADEDYLIEVVGFELGIGEGADAMRTCAGNDVAGEVFELCPREPQAETKIRREKGQRDFDFGFR